MNNTNNYTLITGGSEGIGFELARQFAMNGHNLILVARDTEQLLEAKNELETQKVRIMILSKDLFDVNSAFELYQELSEQNIVVDNLVNNAGQGVYGLFEETDIRRELAIIQLNVASLTVLTKLFLQDMLARGSGRILNVSSIASKVPGPWQSVYHGTKAFVQSFSEALRIEVKDKGITITTLLPGATDTDFFNKADMEASKILDDRDKLSDPADVARDGYDALMKGDDKVISGFKNKVSVAMSNVMPESQAAEMMKKQQEPSTKKHS